MIFSRAGRIQGLCRRLCRRMSIPRVWAACAVVAAATIFSCAAPMPVKPPPVDVSRCRDCHAGNKAYPLAADVYQYWESSGHGLFLKRRDHIPDCAACHDLQGSAGHLDGMRNLQSRNTYHLVQGYLSADPVKECDVQVAFDNYCWTSCHQPLSIPDMRHERDGDPAKGAVLMGQHGTLEKALGDSPMDSDISLARPALSGPPYCAPCVSCHNPHGTGATSKTGATNRMARDSYREPSRLCGRCH